ncbi:hypothetical protein BH11CYA1_BH11CYA1_18070 [soil metagenome]
MGSDIMAMTHTSPQELRAAIANPESQQYHQLAERIGASPALVDSALHGNMSAAVVASAGFGTTETARAYEGQSVTASQAMHFSESAQSAAIASGASNGADVVRQAAISMDPGAGQAILGGTGLASQFTSTVAAYQAEASSGRGYMDAPSVPNVIASQAQDYSGGYVQPANYVADSGYSEQPQYTADSGYREATQPVVNTDSGYAGATEIASAAPWLGDVAPDTSHQGQADTYYQQQQQQQQHQQQQQQAGVVYGSDGQTQARPNRLADALGGAAIAKIGGAGQKPTGGAPVAKTEGGAPPPQQVAVNKGLDPQAAKRTGKTKAQMEAELAEELRRQGQNMPGGDGMA